MTEKTIKGYKVFYLDIDGMYCEPDEGKLRYEVGKTYFIEGEMKACNRGIIYYKELKDIADFYPIVQGAICEIEDTGTKRFKSKNKFKTNKIKIVRRLDWVEILHEIKGIK